MNVAPMHPAAQAIACLTAVGRFHGLDVSEGQLAHLAAGGMVARPAEIVQLAQKVGLSAKAARLNWDGLRRLGAALPAILPLKEGCVILSGIRESEGRIDVVTRSPAASEKGFQFWDRQALEQIWRGDIVLLKRKYALSDAAQPFSLKWFVPQFLRQRRA